MSVARKKVAVIGAGLQGSSIALELASRALDVDLIDAHKPMSRASRWNEGKLHLGFVYGRDNTLATARVMIKGTAHIARFMNRHFGAAHGLQKVSRPFDYLVHRESLVGATEFHTYLQSCSRLMEEGFEGVGESLWSADTERSIRERPVDRDYNSALIEAAFRTPEIALDPRELARVVTGGLEDSERIRLISGVKVESVTRKPGGYALGFACGSEEYNYDVVINCTWERRLALDRQVGIAPPRRWLHRYKLGSHIRCGLVTESPSFTVALGAFGDFVNYGSGNYYTSWYPTGRVGVSADEVPPDFRAWLTAEMLEGIDRSAFEALCEIAPGLGKIGKDTADVEVEGGYIFAWGDGDVSVYETQLHERASIGISSVDNYFSVNTGKMSTATMHAEEIANRVCGMD